MEVGRAADAASAFRDAVAAAPEEEHQLVGAAATNLGNALRMLGHAAEALDHCRRAVAAAPDLAEAHHNLGAVMLDLGQPGEAQRALERAERRVTELEERVAALTKELEAPGLYDSPDGVQKASALGAQLQRARADLDAAVAEWERASAEVEAVG